MDEWLLLYIFAMMACDENSVFVQISALHTFSEEKKKHHYG